MLTNLRKWGARRTVHREDWKRRWARGLAVDSGPSSGPRRASPRGVGVLLAVGLAFAVASAQAQDGDLRLADVQATGKGRLEIHHAGTWGGVCDDFWVFKQAKVACRQLGYRREKAELGYLDGPSGRQFLLDNVWCEGSEARLADCQHRGWGVHDCSQGEYAGVECDIFTLKPIVVLSPRSVHVDEEDSDGGSYQVHLGKEPSANVVVAVTAPTGVTATSTSLTFTTTNWDTPQTVTLTAAADTDAEAADATLTVTHAATGATEFASRTLRSVTVHVWDDDLAQVAGVEVAAGSESLLVSWSAVLRASGYKVQWTSGTETFADASTDNRELAVSGQSRATISGLTAGTEYTVRVIATASDRADGPPSAERMGTPFTSTLTAAFDAPSSHDGQREFTVRVTFSEALATGIRKMREDAFEVTRGTITRARRVNRNRAVWDIRISPHGQRNVTLSLAAGRSCDVGVCTENGGTLTATVTATVMGPSGMSNADLGVGTGGLGPADGALVQVDGAGWVQPEGWGSTVCDGTLSACAFRGPGVHDSGYSGAAAGSPMLLDALASGHRIVLRYGAALDAGSVPSPADFAVWAGPGGLRTQVAVEAVTVVGAVAHLSLARAVSPEETVTLDYLTAPMHPLQDAAGGAAAPLSNVPVRYDATASWADNVGRRWREPLHALLEAARSDPQGATRLDLSFRGLTDVSALSGFTGLRELDLRGNRIADLTPLSGLTALHRLDLSDNAVVDVSPLAGLAALRRLDLSGNAIEIVEALSGLSGLEVLLLHDNRIDNVAPLSRLPGLNHLELDANAARRLQALAAGAGAAPRTE